MRPLVIAAAATAWLLLTAGSCATTQGPEPKVIVQTVEVPVAVNCATAAPPKPDLVDKGVAIVAAPDIFRRAQLLLAGRDQRDAYIAKLEASRAGCP